jgi:Rieske 2Fe-2S family protein
MSDRAVAAPIDPRLLEPVLAPLGRSRTLPAAAYTSEEVLAFELRRLWQRSWVCAGHAGAWPLPGYQAAVSVAGQGVLLLRDQDGTLRGFFNVCRHRGHELLQCGTAAVERTVRCPYHAWVYRLDGRLRTAPRFGQLDPDDPVREGLVPARVAEWHGWVFVDVSGEAPDLAEHLGNLGALLAPYRPEALLPAASRRYLVRANWKLLVENYHECYHCPSIHPELCRVTPPDSGEDFEPSGMWAGGSMDLRAHAETMSLDGRGGGPPLPWLPEAARRQVLYLGLFPNLLVSAHPDYVLTHRLEPLAPDQTQVECEWLFPAEAVAAAGFDPAFAVDFWDVTNRQDFAACESVQRGTASHGYRQGPLAPQEGSARHFLTMVAAGYLNGTPTPPLPPEPRRPPRGPRSAPQATSRRIDLSTGSPVPVDRSQASREAHPGPRDAHLVEWRSNGRETRGGPPA